MSSLEQSKRPRNKNVKKVEFSAASIVAVVAAVVSFFVAAGWGFLLALIAIVSGLIGFVMAIAPGVRGGIASILSMMGGAAGIVVALVKLLIPG